MYFLDANICIYFLKGKYKSIEDRLKRILKREIKIPVIVKAELYYGVEKSQKKEENRIIYEKFVNSFDLIQFNNDSLRHYARIRLALENNGTIIGENDLLIASIVLGNNGILVTHNVKEFGRIPGLQIEDWVV